MQDQDPIELDDLFEDDEDSTEGRYLTFSVGTRSYGLAIQHVTEIVGVQRITPVPDTPAFVQGVINLRGNVIPVMDVRLRFGMESREHDERTCIIVVETGDVTVGLLVDRVAEVTDIPPDAITVPPDVHTGEGKRFMQGLGRLAEDVVILLDLDRLLYDGAAMGGAAD